MYLENQINIPMCNINRIDPRIVSMGLDIIGKLIESELSVNQPSTDILGSATLAYQQGKITKSQYFAVINALDETTTVQTTARTETSGERWNREYLEANAYLNQFRG